MSKVDISSEAVERVAWAIAGVIANRRCDGKPAINDQRRAEARAAIAALTVTPQEAEGLLEKMTHHHLPLALMTEADDEGDHLQWVLVDASSNTVLGSGETALEALRAISEDRQ